MTSFLVHSNLSYGEHQKQKLDLFVPQQALHVPFVVLIHGGGWTGGGKQQYQQTAMILAEAGIACATIGYRLMPETVWPEIVFDVIRGWEFLRLHKKKYNIEPEKIITWGSSAGGHSALIIQAYSELWLQKRCFLHMPKVCATIVQCPVLQFKEAFPPEDVKQKYLDGVSTKEVSPLEIEPYLFKNVILFQGDNDTTTPISFAKEFIDNIKKVGNLAELVIYPNAEHGFGYNTLNHESIKSIEFAIHYIKQNWSLEAN